MSASRQQFVLAMAAITTAMLLCSTSARAGYVSVVGLAEQDGVDALANSGALLAAGHETSSGTAGDTANTPSDADDPHAPAQPTSRLLKLPTAAHNLGHSGAGSPSSSVPGGGPSSLVVGDLPHLIVPPLQQTSLLPPQTGEAHSFSVASFLFRPPRAA